MAKPALEEQLLTTSQLAERYHMSELTLRKWRWRGIGPRWVKIAGRALYPESEVARWEANRRRCA